MGRLIDSVSFLVGFDAIWHLLLLGWLGLGEVIISIIIRTSDDNSEYTLSAAHVKKLEAAAGRGEPT